ncbi:MAG: sensor domain-containing diguanylate cyclase [Chloroflexi bacterium]|nr:sensor domain-containing diguanylate cyclase [Chloroflexota bacterium]
MTFDSLDNLDPAQMLRREQERSAQLETYAADLNRTYGKLRRHLQHMTVLHEVNIRIASALDPDEVLAGVLDSLGQLLQYRTAAVYLLDLDLAVLPDAAQSPDSTRALPRLRACRAFDEGGLDMLEGVEAGADSTVADVMRDQQTIGRMTPHGALQLVVPLRAGGRSLGALELVLGEPLGEDDVRLVELLAASAAVALQNAHLYRETQRLATTDALTGLSNYRHFHDLLSLEVQRARRMNYAVGLVIMDLDHFKLVNDRHGHPVGDATLHEVAEQLRKRLRRTDVIGRIGGEEFAAILPGDSLQEVAIVAEKLRRAVEELPAVRGGMSTIGTHVTLSVGGTSLTAEAVDAEQLISSADQALYQAKHAGRNRVCLWTEPVPAPADEPTGPTPPERRSA